MLMTRPRAPWSSNFTRPAVFAKIVSSLPSPAFRLANDDGAAGHDIAVVRFHAEALRVGIAAVA